MTRVVIQPSYGNRDAWRHWDDTMAKQIPYGLTPYAAALTGVERAALDGIHPAGRARFWGATGNHDKNMALLEQGDVVLFTGKKLVRGIGEVGHSFRNATFADTLWEPHEERGSYRNVYSLLNFQPTAIPYEEVWELPGFNAGDNFMGLRFLDPEKSATVLDGLAIGTATATAERLQQEQQVVSALVTANQLLDVEAVNVEETTYQHPGGPVLVHRAEALLVSAYRATLAGAEVARIKTTAGITDLFVRNESGVEIVEAKRSADHVFVRQALAQLLAYVAQAPEPIDRLAALFPGPLAADDLALLHRYGIDCITLTDDGSFLRLAASTSVRASMRVIWRD